MSITVFTIRDNRRLTDDLDRLPLCNKTWNNIYITHTVEMVMTGRSGRSDKGGLTNE